MTAASYGVLVLVAALAAIQAGYPAMFSAFTSDDEGYVLLSLHENLSGGAPYDQVYSLFGPGFFVIAGGAFQLLDPDVSHDTGRLITLTLWTATSLLCGASLLRLTGNLLVALGGQVVTFFVLSVMIFEPIHPGGTLAFLLAGIVAVSAFVLRSRPAIAMFVIGALAAAAALIKPNVGLLAILAIAFACANAVSPLRRVGAVRLGVGVALAATPFVLMADSLSEAWALRYALVVALAAIAVVIAASPLPAKLELRPVYALAAGLGLVTSVVLAVVVIEGTTAGGLIDEWAARLLRYSDLVGGEVEVSALAPLWTLLAVCAAALAVRRLGRTNEVAPNSLAWLTPAARIAVGLGIWVAIFRVGGPDPGMAAFGYSWPYDSIGLVAPLAWVAAIPPRRGAVSASTSFIRALVPTLAVVQLLHPYPIPGTQVAWGLFLFAVVGGICVADGLEQLIGAPVALGLAPPRSIGNVGAIAFLAVVAAVPLLTVPVLNWSSRVNSAYDSGVSPGVPGAERLRLPPDQAATFRELSTELRSSCSTFLTLPAFNSLYLFTGLDPPTGMNTDPWTLVLDTRDQRWIVEQVHGIDGLCAVRNTRFVDLFAGSGLLPERPLVRFIQRRFRPTSTISEFDVMQRTGSAR